MSVQSAKAFIEKLKTDFVFAKKVTGCKDKEERTAFVKQAGFEFTKAELEEVSNELSVSELEAVVAGIRCLWETCSDDCGLSELW